MHRLIKINSSSHNELNFAFQVKIMKQKVLSFTHSASVCCYKIDVSNLFCVFSKGKEEEWIKEQEKQPDGSRNTGEYFNVKTTVIN